MNVTIAPPLKHRDRALLRAVAGPAQVSASGGAALEGVTK
jgi:hypothetical protein